MWDPAIKLFGKTIPLAEGGPGLDPDPINEPAGDDKDMYKETANNKIKVTELDVPRELEQGERKGSPSLEDCKENELQTSSQNATEKLDSIPEQDQSETDASGQEKVLKKPDKILPCPRCNSLDTKFCYYNNYNVNQPRHFCKNCQRYWTAGGTMRNVPVGAGRRKNKHSASHYRHIMMSPEGLVSTREAIDSTHPCGSALGSLKKNGTVLKFGPEAPLCESMSSVLNLGEQMRTDFSTEEPSCASSVTASNFVENGLPENIVPKEQNGMPGSCNGLTPLHPLPYYPGPPWAYPWSAGWNNVAAAAAAAAAAMAAGQRTSELANGSETGNMSSLPWSTSPILTAPAFCAPTIPVPFVPASFWPTGGWSVPWAGSNGGLSPSSSTTNSRCSGNGSPTLGKHSRDSSLQGEEKTEKSLWIPKTLRIDDPDEAAKSSIWATLGIKPDEGGMFKAFRSKSEGQGQKPDAPRGLRANPAALSRSQSFREST